MSFINNLSLIYDELTKDENYPDGLYPLGYSEIEIQIEVRIDENSNFLSATSVNNKRDENGIKDSTTLIPITVESLSRTNAPAPHMLFDNLRYLAGDLNDYVNDKVDFSKYHNLYMNQLSEFLKSEYFDSNANIIYTYLKKNRFIADLVNAHILTLNEKNELTEEQYKLFVRFIIIPVNGREINLSRDRNTIKHFSDFYISKNSKGEDLDYCTGKFGKSGTLFQKKICNSGDQTKLISSNDDKWFTFRGIYANANEAVSINQIIADKAHNALRYLIKKQGIFIDKKIILLYGNVDNLSLDFIKDTDLNIDPFDELFEIEESTYDSYDDYANKLKSSLSGYEEKINITDNSILNLLIVDSITSGRLSINYYREFYGNEIKEFLKSIEQWYIDTLWYKNKWNDIDKRFEYYYGTDYLFKIAQVAYGTKTDKGWKSNDIVKKCVMNLTMNVLNNSPLNYSLVKQITYKAFHPEKYNDTQYKTVLKCACQLNKKYYNNKFKKEIIKLDMEKQEYEINYQLGRLLAVMELIELMATKGDRHKDTNVKKYFSKYQINPMKTYMILYNKLKPYESKFNSSYLKALRQTIISSIDPEEFNNIRHLDGRMLCGYDAQLAEFYKNNKNEKKEEEV